MATLPEDILTVQALEPIESISDDDVLPIGQGTSSLRRSSVAQLRAALLGGASNAATATAAALSAASAASSAAEAANNAAEQLGAALGQVQGSSLAANAAASFAQGAGDTAQGRAVAAEQAADAAVSAAGAANVAAGDAHTAASNADAKAALANAKAALADSKATLADQKATAAQNAASAANAAAGQLSVKIAEADNAIASLGTVKADAITATASANAATASANAASTAAENARAGAQAVVDGYGADLTAAKLRANHTGTQAISTVTGLQAALDGKALATALGSAGSNMGTTPGSILSDNGTAKIWFGELEEIAESRSPWTYSSRSDAEAARIPATVKIITVMNGGVALNYVRDSGGTALATADGAKWSPADDVVRPEHFGVVANSASDQTAQITKLIDWTSAVGCELRWTSGTYLFTSYNCPSLSPRVKWSTQGGRAILRSIKATPDTTSTLSEFAINFRGATIRQETVTTNISAGGARINLASTANIVPGETMLIFGSTRMIETDNRGQKRHGFACVASRIVSSTVVELEKAIPIDIAVSDITGVVVTAVGANTCTVSGLSAYSRSDVLYRLKFNTVGGVASGVTALPLAFDPATQTYTFDSNSPRPAGLSNGDSITVERLLACTIANPAIIDIDDGIVFERDPTFTAAPGDPGFRGLQIQRGNRPQITGFEARGFSEHGIVLVECYAHNVSDAVGSMCNRAYNVSDGTGSFISCFQSSWGVFENIHAFGCRRTLDFSGTQGASYHNIAKNITGEGGGTAYDGVRFWPIGATQQSVVGSHGGGFFTRYIDCKGVNVNAVINLRGCDEVVRGVYGAGKIDRMINSFYGDGADIDGVFYTSGNAEWVADAKFKNSTSSGGKLGMVLRIDVNTILSTKMHYLRNVTAKGVKTALVGFAGTGPVGPITVGGNIDLFVDDEDGDEAAFYAFRGISGTRTLTAPVRLDSFNVTNAPNAPKGRIAYTTTSDAVYGAGSHIKLPSGYVLIPIADDAAVKFPLSQTNSVAMLDLRFNTRNRSPRVQANNVEMWVDLATDRSPVPNSVNVDVLATALTGTTGTDGKVSVAYVTENSGSVLYVENRYGSLQHFLIKCDLML